jgi:peptidyl-prolyl cis-trans isomerase SurA
MSILRIRRSAAFGLAIGALVVGSASVHAQGKPKPGKPSKPATAPVAVAVPVAVQDLLEVGREKFTVGQIADAYKKNNARSTSFYALSRDSALEFLNIFANYRLKVQAALDAGIDKRPEVVEDLRKNRIDLTVPPAPNTGYLIERKVVDPAVEAIFKRRDDELLLGLIYISMRPNDPADTARAFRKALHVLELVRGGASFEGIARDSSDDPSTKDNGGRLPSYITAGMILPTIEAAAYETTPGSIYPGLVRVPAGFVVLKVIDRSPRYKVHAAHILVTVKPNGDSAAALRSAQDALRRIRGGEDFAKVAREVSDDHVSAENGGDFLVYYTRSLGFEAKNAKLDPKFESVLYSLKDGEVSDIVQTQYGYHIIKRLDSRRPTFDEEKETIRQFYKQRLMGDDRTAYVHGVEESQGMKINQSIFDQLLAALNQRATSADTAWAAGIGRGLRGEKLYSFRGADYTVGAWIDSIGRRPDMRATPLTPEGVRNSIYGIHEQAALIEAAKNLETEYPEFAALMQEFRDGILIYYIENENVWDKLNKGYDEARGKAFFEAHRKKYMTLPKLGLTEIFLYDESAARAMYQKIKSGTVPFDTLAAQNTERQGYRERAGHWDLATGKNADLVKQVLERHPNAKPGDLFEPFPYQGGFSIVRVDQAEASRLMTYDEAKGDVQGDYFEEMQNQLKKEWLDTLRLKYRVKIDDQALRAALSTK